MTRMRANISTISTMTAMILRRCLVMRIWTSFKKLYFKLYFFLNTKFSFYPHHTDHELRRHGLFDDDAPHARTASQKGRKGVHQNDACLTLFAHPLVFWLCLLWLFTFRR